MPLSSDRLVVEAPKNRVHGGSSYRTQNLRHLWKDTRKAASALPALFSMPLNFLASNIQFPFMPSYPCRHSSDHHLFSHMFPFSQCPQRIRLRQQLEIGCNCISRQAFAELTLGPHHCAVAGMVGSLKAPPPCLWPSFFLIDSGMILSPQ